ncbi:MAG: pyrroline-5-carboxylate reductase [Candidatus Omnitrophota bacterium]
MIDKKIGMIGCGNMGEAMIRKLSAAVADPGLLIASDADPARRDSIKAKYGVATGIDNAYLVSHSDVVILAVKPKDLEKILYEDIRRAVSKDKLLISIAAGITTDYIGQMVGKGIPVIRVMPNMAATIGEGISAISAGPSAGAEDMKTAKEIFSAVGDVVEVDEGLMDAVTALSGSGPAYFFYMMEALMEAAAELGLDEHTAGALVRKTAAGSSRLVEVLKESPGDLSKKVASKGGTTEAAFKVFGSKKFKAIIKAAVKAACKRSKEISKVYSKLKGA